MVGTQRSYSTTALLTPIYSAGFCASMMMVSQLLTGLLLATDYNASSAFTSCALHLRELDTGWVTRTVHAVGASILLSVLYVHMGRCIYMASTVTRSTVWLIGVLMYLLLCGVCFTGYSLVYGQMSLWAIVVISNLVAAVTGPDVLAYMWGNSVVGTATLTRFFVVHYLLPLLVTALSLVHVLALHSVGSTGDQDVLVSRTDKVNLVPLMLVRDLAVLSVLLTVVGVLLCSYSEVFGHSDNWVHGDALVTPALIAPEWYLLPFYGVLRAVPSKLLGVLCMAIALLGLLPLLGTLRVRSWCLVNSTRWFLSVILVDAVLAGILCLQCNSLDVLYGALLAVVLSWLTQQLVSSVRQPFEHDNPSTP